MCLPGFRQRKNAIDDGPQPLFAYELQNRVQLGAAAHVRTEQRQLAREEITQIELRRKTGGGATGHETAAGRKAQNALLPSGGADVLEYDVHASLDGEAPDFFGNLLLRVIDDLIGTEVAGFFQFSAAAGRGDHTRTHQFG